MYFSDVHINDWTVVVEQLGVLIVKYTREKMDFPIRVSTRLTREMWNPKFERLRHLHLENIRLNEGELLLF